jgi:IS4 transposase
MNKFFKMIAAVTLMAAPASGPRRFSVFNQLPPRVELIGAGKPVLDRFTVKELRKLATTMKIKGRSKARRKADLIALIRKSS